MKIGVCGNENTVKQAIRNSSRNELVGVKIHCYNIQELLLDVEEGFFDSDIIIFSIGLYGNDYNKGIDLIKSINSKFPRCQVIYITDNNYIDDVYDTKHIYLLPREYVINKMDKALDKAIQSLSYTLHKDVLEIKSSGNRKYINKDEIIYIERDGRRILIATTNGYYYCYESIKEIRKKLTDTMVQVNGGSVLNLKYITYLGKGTIELSHKGISKKFPVGRTFLKTTKEAYYNFWEKDSG
ncbi:MAG: hypothetical protein E7257_07975 [Lachnospiraceae bacterium]|nr:hypothetical protein [Lachnospiraceae bacterium]